MVVLARPVSMPLPGWSARDLARLGSRHSRVRDESYAELQAVRDKLRAEVETARREQGELTARLDGIFGRLRELARPSEEIKLDDCEKVAAIALHAAVLELVGH